MEVELKQTSWMLWSSSGGPSNRWSLDHFVINGYGVAGDKTLCGRIVPDSFDYDRGGYGDICHLCKARKEIYESIANNGASGLLRTMMSSSEIRAAESLVGLGLVVKGASDESGRGKVVYFAEGR